jgi:hypothetical protein
MPDPKVVLEGDPQTSPLDASESPVASAPESLIIPAALAPAAQATVMPPVYIIAAPTLTWPEAVFQLDSGAAWNPATPVPEISAEARREITAVLTESYAARSYAYATGDLNRLEDYFTGRALEYESLRIASFRSHYNCSQELRLEVPLRVDVVVVESDLARAYLTKQESRICHRGNEIDESPNLTVYDDFYAVELELTRIDGRWYISDRPYP